MEKAAIISECGFFRYRLSRRWAIGPVLLFIMLNPSIADAEIDDNTIAKCVGFAQLLGFAGIEVVNLFAFRATAPRELKASGWRVGPMNAHHVARATAEVVRDGGKVVLAWGANARGRWEADVLVKDLVRREIPLHALRVLADGTPGHPLRLPYSCKLQVYVPKHQTEDSDKTALQMFAGRASGLVSNVRTMVTGRHGH